MSERLAVRGAALMAATLQRWLDGGIEPAPQDEGAVTFTKRLSREDGRIDWGDGADEIARQVRAYRPWPGSFTFWRGARVEIVEASPAEGAGGPAGDGARKRRAPHRHRNGARRPGGDGAQARRQAGHDGGGVRRRAAGLRGLGLAELVAVAGGLALGRFALGRAGFALGRARGDFVFLFGPLD